LIILAPSLVLLYSSSSIKAYDYLQQVTGNQWFWNYASTDLAASQALGATFNLDLTSLYNSYIRNDGYDVLVIGLWEALVKRDHLTDISNFDYY